MSASVFELRQRVAELDQGGFRRGAAFVLFLDHFGRRLRDELLVGQLLLDAGDVALVRAISFSRRAISALRSIRAATSRHAVASSSTMRIAPFGGSSASATLSSRARRSISV